MIQKVILSEPAPGASSRYDTEGVFKRSRGREAFALKPYRCVYANPRLRQVRLMMQKVFLSEPEAEKRSP